MVLFFVLIATRSFALPNDTTKQIKLPKHYFSKTVYVDYYAPEKRTLDTANAISRKLKTYKISQFTIGYNVPIVTKDFYNKDSTRISNIHFLLCGSYSKIDLNFEGISTHHFTNLCVGLRSIYNNGKKSIFFVEVSPFVTADRGYRTTRTYRLSTTVLYDLAANDNLSFRFGFSRSYLFGNLFNLPYLGIRIGRLDRVYFSAQFPRSVSLNVPVGSFVRGSIYAKPQGGFYTFGNGDSLQLGLTNEHQRMYFGRSEYLTGIRFDVFPSKHFTFYLSGGLTSLNSIEFFPANRNPNVFNSYKNYYAENIDAAVFINLGLVYRFGKTKSIYNNLQMYDAFDLNNQLDPGDNNENIGNGNIPFGKPKHPRLKTEEVMDLLDGQTME